MTYSFEFYILRLLEIENIPTIYENFNQGLSSKNMV